MNKSFDYFLYFFNDINYLKNLSKKDEYKNFNEMILIKKKDSFLQLFTFISIIIILESIIFYSKLIRLQFLLISVSILFLFNLLTKLLIINYFSNTYTNFIKLCEVIVVFENKIKNKIKMISMLKSPKEETVSNIIKIIKEIKYIINSEDDKTNIINKEIIFLFNEYQDQKQKLFKYIFFIYEKEFLIKELYIIKYIKLFCNYSKYINYKLNYLINILNDILKKINIEEINFDILFKDYEKYINNNIKKQKDKNINELNNSIYNLFESNYKLNEYYINLMKEINEQNCEYEKINEIIDYIIEKKKLSISLLEQIKTKINKENDINDNNDIKSEENTDDIKKNINTSINKNNNNKISLSDIQLNNYIFDNQNKNLNNEQQNKNLNNNKKSYDIINEQKKMELLKSDFIEELNKYCKSKKNLNKDDSDICDNNEEKINKNVIGIEKSKENDFNINSLKMDFAKSLTESLKKNKNLNFSKDNKEKEN